MASVYGEYKVSMDAKGRLLVPADFRKQLPESDVQTYVVKRGLDNCLTLYVLSEWEKLSPQLDEMSAFNPKVQKFKRLFLDGINLLEVDSAGRILIPKPLQEYAGLNKEIIFWAQGNKVEIWDKASKEAYIAAQQQEEEDLANELFN